mmetsp:Transcript_21488/g.52917  ORF Transcript_21488/g.52917 Transcript_21488/m.52917 type:complete len:226 (+) Transcript_21488:86-763(+)|eukprot:CAMPEP_0174897268 /NCGR_PEP_ID=MMETSP0167-20121228/12352_1 /TAXON_ID=38298 /ORGANISM="Rhodella maculata, Strain CCMP736" /LENGTH=225 /DNA_ID=CAMNT_0016137117 /DNA_START=12 /DNA_END=689 /DNA_ORIENTATION=+
MAARHLTQIALRKSFSRLATTLPHRGLARVSPLIRASFSSTPLSVRFSTSIPAAASEELVRPGKPLADAVNANEELSPQAIPGGLPLPQPSTASFEIQVSPRCVQRMKTLSSRRGGKELALRISVEGGGCSGFQYVFRIEDVSDLEASTTLVDARIYRPGDEKEDEVDLLFEVDGMRFVTDSVSVGYLNGAEIDFEDGMMRSGFVVQANPNAGSGCSCGTSFTPK